jgi:hypothetical protein
MLSGEHRSGAPRIARSHSCTPQRIPARELEPTDQVTHRSAGRTCLGGRVERREVKSPRAFSPAVRLGLHLDEFIVTGERGRFHRYGVLGRFRHTRPALRRREFGASGWLTGSKPQGCECEGKPHGTTRESRASRGLRRRRQVSSRPVLVVRGRTAHWARTYARIHRVATVSRLLPVSILHRGDGVSQNPERC